MKLITGAKEFYGISISYVIDESINQIKFTGSSGSCILDDEHPSPKISDPQVMNALEVTFTANFSEKMLFIKGYVGEDLENLPIDSAISWKKTS